MVEKHFDIDKAASSLVRETIKIAQKFAHEERNAKSKRQAEVERALTSIITELESD